MFLSPVHDNLVREKVARPEDKVPKDAIFQKEAVHKKTTLQEGVACQVLTNVDTTTYKTGAAQSICPTEDDRVRHQFVEYLLNRKKRSSRNRFLLNQKKIGLFPDPALLPDLEQQDSLDQPVGLVRQYLRPELINWWKP